MSESRTPSWATPDDGYTSPRIATCMLDCGELVCWWSSYGDDGGKRTAHGRDGRLHRCGESPTRSQVEPETPGNALGEMRNDAGELLGWLVAPSQTAIVLMPDTIGAVGTFTVESDPGTLDEFLGQRVALVPILDAPPPPVE